jgi:hypothetical protein
MTTTSNDTESVARRGTAAWISACVAEHAKLEARIRNALAGVYFDTANEYATLEALFREIIEFVWAGKLGAWGGDGNRPYRHLELAGRLTTRMRELAPNTAKTACNIGLLKITTGEWK